MTAPTLSDVSYNVGDASSSLIFTEFTVPTSECVLTQAMTYTIVSPTSIPNFITFDPTTRTISFVTTDNADAGVYAITIQG